MCLVIFHHCYYSLSRKVELRAVTFCTASLPCPLLQHMGWLGGSSTRTAAPPSRRCGRKDHSRDTALKGDKRASMYVYFRKKNKMPPRRLSS